MGGLKHMDDRSAIAIKLEAAGIKVYKIRLVILESKRGKSPAVIRKEHIILDSKDSANIVYRAERQELGTYQYMSRYSGFVELFEPHIFHDGNTAYWPDNRQYIERSELADGKLVEAKEGPR
jgi:hypothetical protein